MTNNDSPGVITQDQFDQYTAHWLSAASAESSAELAASFLASSGERLLFVSFSIQRITWLVSAVGVRQIKARFVLVPGEANQIPHFSLVLFAADEAGEPLSAYYLADQYWLAAAVSPVLGEEVPGSLAAIWLANWKAAPQITQALFATTEGPLQGYNFGITDFIDPLFQAKPFTNQEIHLGLALHDYHAPHSNGDSLTQTFGLVLSLYTPGQQGSAVVSDEFYDMSVPCPPGH